MTVTSGVIKYISAISLVLLFGAAPAPAVWTGDGVPVCLSSPISGSHYTVSDGSGGAIVFWREDRTDITSVYMQWIGPYGDLKWDPDGVLLCDLSSGVSVYHAVSDGVGGAFVTWTEVTSSTQTDVYIQRIDRDGEKLWGGSGISLCPDSHYESRSKLVPDGEGGVFIMWEDRRTAETMLLVQRFSGAGEKMWDGEGENVPGRWIPSALWDIHKCDGNGCIAVWKVSTVDDWWICARKIGMDGSPGWGDATVLVRYPYTWKGFASCAAPGGGVFVTWIEMDRFNRFQSSYAQHVGADGSLLWTQEGVLADSMEDFELVQPRVVPSEDGAIVFWNAVYYQLYMLYAQRIDADGSLPWGGPGKRISYTTAFSYRLDLLPDAIGGAISVSSGRDETSQYRVLAQHIDSHGIMSWSMYGLRVCTAGANQHRPEIMADAGGNYFVTWYDLRSEGSLYCLRMTHFGNPVSSTVLDDHSAVLSGPDILISWTLEEAAIGLEYHIYRAAEEDTVFTEIEDPEVTGSGMSFSFRDRDAYPSVTYSYRITIIDEEPERLLFETGPVTTAEQPSDLIHSYPNPFFSFTDVRYFNPTAGHIILDIYDVRGRFITMLVDEDRDAGYQIERWRGRDSNGSPVPSGVYIVRLRSHGKTEAKKIVLLRH